MNKVNNGKTLWAGRPILGTSHRKPSMLFFINSSQCLREHAGSLRCCASQIVLMMLRPEWGRDCRPECSMLFFMNRKFSCCEGNVFQKALWKMKQSHATFLSWLLQKTFRVGNAFGKNVHISLQNIWLQHTNISSAQREAMDARIVWISSIAEGKVLTFWCFFFVALG